MLRAEEEDMAQYTQDDLEGDWEFKIVRSDSAAFRKPEVLNKLIEEEAQAGWTMLEKFDDSRVRFKRPRSARARDTFRPEGVDPYRTRYGTFATQSAVLATLVGLLLLAGLAFGLFFAGEPPVSAPVVWAVVAGLGLVLVVVAAVAMQRRQS